MKDKVALVIGGSGGIGAEVVEAMLSENINVCSTYCNKQKNMGQVDCKLNEQDLFQMDLLNEASVSRVFQQILRNYGKIDIVVFSVSQTIENKQILDITWADLQKHLDLQTKGLFNVMQSLKQQIKSKRKTKFVIILTEYCIGKPPAGVSAYVTAKYSLMGLAKSMAVELAKFNCTVNMISPGMVKTDLISNLPSKLVEITAENNPLKRIATPKDVANVVLFLSSDKSDYLNGVNIVVNGGGIML